MQFYNVTFYMVHFNIKEGEKDIQIGWKSPSFLEVVVQTILIILGGI